MDYIEIDIRAIPKAPASDILTAYLAEIGFEMFEETETGIKAYIQQVLFDEDLFTEAISLGNDIVVSWEKKIIKDRNWNEEWEKNFQPVVVENCCVRASFHPRLPGCDLDIVIEPKMSFGTGHHATTALMI